MLLGQTPEAPVRRGTVYPAGKGGALETLGHSLPFS